MADRTVSVALTAEVGDLIAKLNLAAGAVEAFEAKVDGAGKSTGGAFTRVSSNVSTSTSRIRSDLKSTGASAEDFGNKVDRASRKASDSVTKAGQSVKKSTDQARIGMFDLVTAAVALSPPVIAAAAAFGAFGAVAAPSIIKVVTAQKDLANSWSTLDARQKATSAHMNAVIDQYKALAKSYEPQALSLFNDLLGDTSVLMQRSGPLFKAGAVGVSAFTSQVDSFVTGGTMTRFLNFASTNATPAFTELGQTFTQTGTLALNLVQDLAPVGIQLLGVANGGLRMLNALEQINPALVQTAATLLAVRGPANALGNLWTSGAGKLNLFGKAAQEAEGSTATLNKTVGSSPNLYIGAALAVGLLSWHWATAKDATDNYISSQKIASNAVGNNISGWQAYAKALGNASVGQQTYNQNLATSKQRLNEIARAGGYDPQKYLKVKEAIDATNKSISNINQGQTELAQKYGITTQQANQLATAAGVDLSKGITGSGAAAKAAQAKLDGYRAAMLAAEDPTKIVSDALVAAGNSSLALKDRMTALGNAFAALAAPELGAFDATTKTAEAFNQMDAAIKKSHGSMSLQTQAGRDARTAFAGLLSTVQQNIDAQYQYDNATKGAAAAEANRTASAQKLLPVLLAEAGANKDARSAVLDWANAAGVGHSQAEALAGALGQTKSQFLAAAHDAGVSESAARALWAAYSKIPGNKATTFSDNAEERRAKVQAYQFLINALHGKNVTINDNAADAAGRVNRVLQAINALHNRTVTITTRQVIETIEIAHRTSQAEHARANGGIDAYAGGGIRRDLDPFVAARPTVLFGETETGGEAYIPLGSKKRARSMQLLSDVAKLFGLSLVKPMADGGILSFANGGTTGDLNFSNVLSDWSSAVKPSTKAQLDAALKNRRTQVNQLASAEDALARARKKGDTRGMEAAERRITAERSDLASATAKLTDVEARYKYSKQSAATQLGSALSLDSKSTATFIKNLTTLADKGYGALAQQLLAMGGPQAEKIAADAVKFSSSKLKSLQGKITSDQSQQSQLANLPAVLATKSALKSGQGSTWVGLLNATGLAPDMLAAALKSMLTDLNKTASGKALIADMHAHGYAHGGLIGGTGGPTSDSNLIRASRGEFMTNAHSTARYRPWLEAINSDRLDAFVRTMVAAGPGARPVTANASTAAAGATIHNTFQTQQMDVHELSQNVSRELAWQLG